jgi:hypothetical protein
MSEDSNGDHDTNGREDDSVELLPGDPFRDAYHSLVDELSRIGDEMRRRIGEAGRVYEADRAGAWRDYATRRDEIFEQAERDRPESTQGKRRSSPPGRDGPQELDEMRAAAERARDEARDRYRDEVRDAHRQAEAAIRSAYADYVRRLRSALAGRNDQIIDLVTLAAVGESMVAAARRTSAALAAARFQG